MSVSNSRMMNYFVFHNELILFSYSKESTANWLWLCFVLVFCNPYLLNRFIDFLFLFAFTFYCSILFRLL